MHHKEKSKRNPLADTMYVYIHVCTCTLSFAFLYFYSYVGLSIYDEFNRKYTPEIAAARLLTTSHSLLQ